MKYNLVAVFWDDAETDIGWDSITDDKLEPKICCSVGFLLKSTKQHLLLAGTIDTEEENSNTRIQIPRKMIKEIVEIDNGDTYNFMEKYRRKQNGPSISRNRSGYLFSGTRSTNR